MARLVAGISRTGNWEERNEEELTPIGSGWCHEEGGEEQWRRVADLRAFYSPLCLGCEQVYPDEATQEPSSGFPRCLEKVSKQDCGNLYRAKNTGIVVQLLCLLCYGTRVHFS